MKKLAGICKIGNNTKTNH